MFCVIIHDFEFRIEVLVNFIVISVLFVIQFIIWIFDDAAGKLLSFFLFLKWKSNGFCHYLSFYCYSFGERINFFFF